MMATDYKPPLSSTLHNYFVPAKAAKVAKNIIKYLQKLNNLTLTYNRQTNCKQELIYTVHVLTPKQEVFLICSDSSSAESHTGKHIVDILIEVRIY
jgi:hypothetical protein